MGRPSGFVPIRFRFTGLLLLVLGTAGLLGKILAHYAHQLLPPYLLPGSLALLIVGAYLIFISPANNKPGK
jgi:predicted MFS family arabinose efflux permease